MPQKAPRKGAQNTVGVLVWWWVVVSEKCRACGLGEGGRGAGENGNRCRCRSYLLAPTNALSTLQHPRVDYGPESKAGDEERGVCSGCAERCLLAHTTSRPLNR
uniref:Secreted protein n=1 Tax=Trypanosoma vivax (strain Y486) TaxID=1055687 RepID=G0TZ38_TRYVY|nr:hypothetical protein, unlikely [Trypanosoma vivax Y486]